MNLQNSIKATYGKTTGIKRKITASTICFKQLYTIGKNRRAVSVVLSNLILVAAVIVVGFSVIAWEQSQAIQYQQTLSGIINNDMNQLQERLSFEFISYNGTTLKVNIINSGTNNNINVTSIKVGNNPSLIVDNLYLLDGTQVNGLSVGQDGYFIVNLSPSLTHGTYSIEITTSRRSNFATSFVY